jgi:predicted dehydrogenase
MPKLDVLIVGCGKIAGGFDENNYNDGFRISHAGAYSVDDRFSIVACIDPDLKTMKKFMKTWGVKYGYESIDDFIASQRRVDVISICSPTENHVQDIAKAVGAKPKVIFCEKPLGKNYDACRKIVELCHKARIPLAINYSRRWDESVIYYVREITAGRFGSFRGANGIYSKGIYNNGSHMIDLISQLVGKLNLSAVGSPVYDYYPDDPSVPFMLEADGGQTISLGVANSSDYTIFELNLAFEKCVLSMERGGEKWRVRKPTDSELYKGYKFLTIDENITGRYNKCMHNAIDNIFKHIDGNVSLRCTGDLALEAENLCNQVLSSVIKKVN